MTPSTRLPIGNQRMQATCLPPREARTLHYSKYQYIDNGVCLFFVRFFLFSCGIVAGLHVFVSIFDQSVHDELALQLDGSENPFQSFSKSSGHGANLCPSKDRNKDLTTEGMHAGQGALWRLRKGGNKIQINNQPY